jgi:hypothetical protein
MGNNNIDRRNFLKLLAGGAVSAALLKTGLPSLGQVSSTFSSRSEPLLPDFEKSLVIRVRCPKVLGYDGLNRRLLREMISYGLNDLVGVDSLPLAFKELFSKKDTIGFKFNSAHAGLLGTNVSLAEEFLRLLVRHGYSPERILFIEVQPTDETLPKCGKARFGWGKEIPFGSGNDSFATVLEQVTALVNVGALKANAVARMSGCLKNMAYGVIKHPARFHANHCTPYIADIFSLPEIRGKVRFNLLSALRVLLRDDQLHPEVALVDEHCLLFGRDVVAVDATGFEILDTLRKKKGIKSPVEEEDFPKQLVVAAQKGLGVYHPDQIQVKNIEV